MRELQWAILCFTLFLASACREPVRPVESTAHIRLADEKLIDFNRGVVKVEEQEIEDFLLRYGWNVKQTPTGLRYLIYKKGNGKKAMSGMLVRFNYTVKLLNGTLAYSSDSLGEKSFILGHGGVESGLEEGMLLLREGDRAKFIIPSYLAYGLLGDQDKIPPGASLVYDVNMIGLKSTY
ncbi:MAG: FKBP-type peptidyl-prolyl cis-trans isomerase [Bacteroidales bacterium]|nr:FKBP-type peptidyl-prolyl cis-trans isomerase [Bacteroidales bacterium]